jgi:hypothetical protein
VITTENIGRCPRCHRFLVAEELSSHQCKIEPKRWVEEIFLEGITDSTENGDGDTVTVGFGLDGRYYRFVVCKHKPPHSLKSRWVTGKNESPEGNSTRARALSSLRDIQSPSNVGTRVGYLVVWSFCCYQSFGRNYKLPTPE